MGLLDNEQRIYQNLLDFGQPQTLASLIAQYFDIGIRGGGNPVYTTPDNKGLRTKDFNISGNVQANIPMDKLINDAILNLRASGFGYGGGVKFPESMQRIGSPDKIEYFDRGIDNLGIGFQKGLENGLFSLDGNYNPQTNDKSINAKLKLNF